MKIAICTPINRLTGIYFWIDLIDLMFHLAQEKYQLTFIFNDSSAPLNIKREEIAERALQWGADYLLWLDDDMRFGADVFEKLLKHDKDIISGIYIDRYGQVICKLKGQKIIPDKILKKDKLIEIESSGFGIFLIKSDVFKKLKKPWFDWKLGRPEDLDFCLKAIEQGYKVYADPMTFLGHGYAERNRYLVIK